MAWVTAWTYDAPGWAIDRATCSRASASWVALVAAIGVTNIAGSVSVSANWSGCAEPEGPSDFTPCAGGQAGSCLIGLAGVGKLAGKRPNGKC